MTTTHTPRRIQRSRQAGWRAPLDAHGRRPIYVGRGTRWGNPFAIGIDADDPEHAAALYREWLENNSYEVHAPTTTTEQRQQMDARRDQLIGDAAMLTGRDLMCWCPLPETGQSDHCHEAVLLDLANPDRAVLGSGPDAPAATPGPNNGSDQ